jgi:hypothetical protein
MRVSDVPLGASGKESAFLMRKEEGPAGVRMISPTIWGRRRQAGERVSGEWGV